MKGIVNIHGNEYKTVAYRVNEFRNTYSIKEGWGIVSEVVESNEALVLIKATVYTPNGVPVATGHAEEKRTSSGVNKNAALENAETSAIGRALAAAGFAGSEFASADEIQSKLDNPEKIVLAIDTNQFKNAIQGLKDGATMDDVRQYYHVTEEVEKALVAAIEKAA